MTHLTSTPSTRTELPRPISVPNPPQRSSAPASVISPTAISPAGPLRYFLEDDALGKLVRRSLTMLRHVGFYEMCRIHRGPSCISSSVKSIPHPAAPYLDRLRKCGAPVLQKTPPWSLPKLRATLNRGCHKSAKNYLHFLRDEMAAMIEAGHWLVLPATPEILQLPHLRLSPIGVIPQRERRPRTIVDYSFHGINQDTVSLAPTSMQFGRAFDRFLHRLHHADSRRGPTFLMKLDLADAFMRVPLQLHSIPTLGALLPRHPNEPPLIAFPLVLPMGWVDSPPFFCAI